MKPLQALLALFAFAFLPLYAASLDDLTYATTNGKVTITYCNEAATGELVIPDTIGGNPVTSIGDGAFQDCTSLTSITIPDSVTSIGRDAFLECTSLTSITIPDSVTSIERNAFYRCTSLTSITIGNGVKSIGDYAFGNCNSLTSITIGNGVTSIGRFAFRNCTNLTSITFLGTAPTTVDADAFSDVADGAVALVTSENLGTYIGTNKWNGLTLTDADNSDSTAQLEAQLAQMTAERDAAIAERDARPTQVAYDAVVAERGAAIAERDARFTEDQIRTMSVDHTVGQNEAGKMQVKIAFIQSTDLNTYTPFTVTPDSLSVVDGKICMEFPPSDAENFFFRFGFHNPEPAIVVQ